MLGERTRKICPIQEPHSPHEWIEAVNPVHDKATRINFHTCIPMTDTLSMSQVDYLLFRTMALENWRRHLQGPEGGLGNPDAGEPGPTLFAQVTLALANSQLHRRLTQHQVRSHIRALVEYINESDRMKYGTISTDLVRSYLNLIERALYPVGILEQEIT